VRRDFAGASADEEAALRLAPDMPGYWLDAATLANLAGDHDTALKHLDYGIRHWPQGNVFVDVRAKTLFNLGRYDEAAEAFVQTVRMFPGDEMPVLWLHLARMRAGQPDAAEFAANTAGLSLSGWIRPMFDYYQGRGDYNAALDASRSSGAPDAECVASLLIGEHMMATKDPLAGSYLSAAASICKPTTARNSLMAAWAELKRINPELGGKGWSR
jgi:lipoprotein NlpI